MTKNQERIEKTFNTVETILRETYTIYSKKADQMINDPAFYEMLKKDPVFIGHRRAEYWAAQVIEEFDIVT